MDGHLGCFLGLAVWISATVKYLVILFHFSIGCFSKIGTSGTYGVSLPWLVMRLLPYKPIVSWKYYKLKTHWNTPDLLNIMTFSPAILSMLRALPLACSWAKSSNMSLSYNKVLNISCNWLNTILKVECRMVVLGLVWLWVYHLLAFVISDLTGSCASLPSLTRRDLNTYH